MRRTQVAGNCWLERERPGDDRLEASVGEPLVDESLAAFQASRVARDFHQHVAADREPPAQDVEHGERCRLRAQGTVEEDRPTRAQREMGHGMDRGVRELAVEPVGVQGEARDSADRVTDLEALDARPDRGDGPRRLVTQAGGELGLFQYWPLRNIASARLSPSAWMRIWTSPLPGGGTSTSSTRSTSGPPIS